MTEPTMHRMSALTTRSTYDTTVSFDVDGNVYDVGQPDETARVYIARCACGATFQGATSADAANALVSHRLFIEDAARAGKR